MKKIIFLLLVMFMFIKCNSLTYGGCNSSEVARMKSLVQNINLSYDYTMKNDSPVFSVTLNNITSDIYFWDSATERNYYYSDTKDGEITIYDYDNRSGRYKFYSNNSNCAGISLGVKYYEFPSYNRYYNHAFCIGIPNYSLCQKWVQVNYSEEEFKEKVMEYREGKQEEVEEKIQIEYKKTLLDKIVDIYINYYYYFFGTLILVCTIIIFVNNRKNKFKL